MKYVNRLELRRMPYGTVFVPVTNMGLVDDSIRIITGRYDDGAGFNGTVELTPFTCDSNVYNEYGNLMLDVEHKLDFDPMDETDHDFDQYQLFAVYTKDEVAMMAHRLIDALVMEEWA